MDRGRPRRGRGDGNGGADRGHEAGLAEGWFRNALEKKPDAEPLLTGLGRALLAQEKAEEAVAVLEKAVAANEKSAMARGTLGLARSKAGKPDEGRKDLAAAVAAKARKDLPIGAFLVALVDDRAGKFDEPIAGYEKALAIDPAFLDAHKNLAILCIAQNPLYQDAKRTKKAMEHFQKYADLGGRDPEVRKVFEQLKSFIASQRGSK